MPQGRKTWFLAAGLLLWVTCCGAGFLLLLKYESLPGAAAKTLDSWPSESILERPPGAFTLLLFAHPQCPCTAATMSELERLMSRAPALKTYVLFIRPAGYKQDWEKTSLWRRAQSIKGVTVACDNGGAEAAKFGAVTSGQALLYDERGLLVFRGGITSGRGHEGDNAGVDSILALIEHRPAPYTRTEVFGCSIVSK